MVSETPKKHIDLDLNLLHYFLRKYDKMTSVKDILNERQQEVVNTLEGPVMVLAGAGSGKTKTITHRIKELIEQGAKPESILAITFTNKAAKEMRERVFALLGEQATPSYNPQVPGKPFVSTFHSLCVHILRDQHETLGIPKYFTILDRSETKTRIKKAVLQADLDPKQFDPGKLLHHISTHKGQGTTLAMLEAQSGGDYFGEIVQKVWKNYEQLCQKDKAFDFDDLLLVVKELLRNNETLRKHYQETWKYIHIDEYQDTNGVQHEIGRLLAGERSNLCVVGDIDQNIYSWRGAHIEHLLHFEQQYPECTLILLEQNYRSTQNILRAANDIIKKNKNRKEKVSFTTNNEGDKLVVHQSYNEQEEALWIADTIMDLEASGADLNQIAILYRANFQSRALEEAMLRKGVAYQVLGTRFFDRREVRDLLSYLKCTMNPEDTISLERALTSPKRGIGKVALDHILEGNRDLLKGKALVGTNSFFALMEKTRAFLKEHSLKETMKFLSEESGLLDSLHKEVDAEERIANIFELISVCGKYDELDKEEAIDKLLEDAALASDQDELSKPKHGVKLMTIHAAKGLEFDNVFIAGLEEGLFPYERMGSDGTEDEEEERRLFYVALTRAAHKLFLSYATTRTVFGQTNVNSPSSFLMDIDDEILEYPGQIDESEQSSAASIFIDF